MIKSVNGGRNRESKTWGYRDSSFISVISNESRDPCKKIVVTSSDIIDGKIAHFICSCPKLVVLILQLKNEKILHETVSCMRRDINTSY